VLHKQHHWLGLFLLAATHAVGSAQTAAFEVASVKPAKSDSVRFTMTGGPGTGDPGRILYTNIMLKRVLLRAYDIHNHQIAGPEWLDTERYDIAAKVPDGATMEQFQLMLRNLLATRFQLKSRLEIREVPIYALVPAKNGPKLKAATGGAPQEKPEQDQLAATQGGEGGDGFPPLSLPTPRLVIQTRGGRARVTAKDVPLSRLANLLLGQVGRVVVDMTGLSGNYNFVLYFTPEGPNSADGTDPGIFTALQEQLGLRLEPRRGPLEMLVIDHVEKVPTEN
jgi:uncharacterized protein (TIGR03435 family)